MRFQTKDGATEFWSLSFSVDG